VVFYVRYLVDVDGVSRYIASARPLVVLVAYPNRKLCEIIITMHKGD
jgi:hypothetical protein